MAQPAQQSKLYESLNYITGSWWHSSQVLAPHPTSGNNDINAIIKYTFNRDMIWNLTVRNPRIFHGPAL